MPHMIDITQRLTNVLKLKSDLPCTGQKGPTYSTITDNDSVMISPLTPTSTRRRKPRPAPIDIDLAHQNRAQQALPYLKSPISSPSEYDPSTPRESPEGTPLYVHIYAQLRSPASSTPFPTEPDTPEKPPMPVTAIFEPSASNTPLTATKNSPFRSAGAESHRSSSCSILPTVFATQMENTSYLLSKSKRVRYMLRSLVDPIDTEVETFTTSPTWYRARTPIAGRWDLFRRPSQVRLARLAERAWYGEEARGECADESSSEERSDVDSLQDGSSSGWSGLPSPISPLFV